MIKCVIIDDEPAARNSLEILLNRYFPYEATVAGKAASLREGVTLLQRDPADLVFLDIEMPCEDGFKIFDYFPDMPFPVIFTTAYRDYAIQAIKVAALDYILKPVTQESLAGALSLYRQRMLTPLSPASVNKLITSLRSTAPGNEKVALPTFHGFQMEHVSDIIYCAADQIYTQVHLTDGRLLVISKPLSAVEQLLPEYSFFRIHKSSLVNLNYIKIFSRDGGFHVILEDGTRLDVAGRRRNEFIRTLTHNRNERIL